MQKLTEASFFCYPTNQNLCIYYKDITILESRLFKALSLQISPKEGFLLRFRKTKLGHQLFCVLKPEKVKFNLPSNTNCQIIYKNNDNYVFFDVDENHQPVGVLRLIGENNFKSDNFLGYSLFENYSKSEYFQKRETILKVLGKRWNELLLNEKLHGDFTHFNILLSDKNEIFFIDQKELENSILFDHFYFYSYYVQCLEKCKTTKEFEVLEIKKDLQSLIYDVCNSNLIGHNLENINLNDAIGLTKENGIKFYAEFKQIFEV